ncbi:hypothetical protein [Streptomyces sp. 7N604]|uniref:hypothetical protein n=1 Tax=Streptomyces sp. 7N604 TaxID=3457415 RepID=UPI003FD14367
MTSPVHRAPSVTARIDTLAAGPAETAQAAVPGPDSAARPAEVIGHSADSDAPDITIAWSEPSEYDQARGVATAEVTARFPEAEFVIARLVWSQDESTPERERFQVTGHGAIAPVYFPEDTAAVALWARGYLGAADALGGWPVFEALIRRREEEDAAYWDQQAARNPYL